jgi:hypothetical protein
MSNVNMNIHSVISVEQDTRFHADFSVTNLYIKLSSGETTVISLFNDPSIRPDHFTWSKT